MNLSSWFAASRQRLRTSSTLPVIAAVCRQVAASGKLLHVDVAELNPEYDVDARTAKVAARLIDTLLR